MVKSSKFVYTRSPPTQTFSTYAALFPLSIIIPFPEAVAIQYVHMYVCTPEICTSLVYLRVLAIRLCTSEVRHWLLALLYRVCTPDH